MLIAGESLRSAAVLSGFGISPVGGPSVLPYSTTDSYQLVSGRDLAKDSLTTTTYGSPQAQTVLRNFYDASRAGGHKLESDYYHRDVYQSVDGSDGQGVEHLWAGNFYSTMFRRAWFVRRYDNHDHPAPPHLNMPSFLKFIQGVVPCGMSCADKLDEGVIIDRTKIRLIEISAPQSPDLSLKIEESCCVDKGKVSIRQTNEPDSLTNYVGVQSPATLGLKHADVMLMAVQVFLKIMPAGGDLTIRNWLETENGYSYTVHVDKDGATTWQRPNHKTVTNFDIEMLADRIDERGILIEIEGGNKKFVLQYDPVQLSAWEKTTGPDKTSPSVMADFMARMQQLMNEKSQNMETGLVNLSSSEMP